MADTSIALWNSGRAAMISDPVTCLVASRSHPANRPADRSRHGELRCILKRSLTWDQGSEMSRHREFTIATDVPVSFCDPASPWQRGSNENTNGLLRQYFPRSTDLSVRTPEHLAAVAAELNGRPRETLGWETPAERLRRLLAA
jgi:IS30 family transposase